MQYELEKRVPCYQVILIEVRAKFVRQKVEQRAVKINKMLPGCASQNGMIATNL